MSVIKVLGNFAILLMLTGLQVPARAQDKVTAIVNAVIIDGNGNSPIEDGSIIIRGGKIEAVGSQLKVPSGAEIIDAAGQVAMPGLADMHVHLTWGGEGHDLLGYQRRLNALLYAGVTTVLDTGAVLPFVQQMHQAIEAGKIVGPNIYYVGPLIDSVDPQWPAVSLSMASETQAQKITRYLKNNGVSAIKAYAKLTRPQIVALVNHGKKLGLPVIVDAWFSNGAEHLVTTGLRAFAHTPRRVIDDTLKIMKQNEVQIITTRAVGGIVKHARLRGLSFLQSDLIKNTTPSWLLEKASKDASRALTDKQFANDNFSEHFHKLLQKNVKLIFDAGIPLVAGTDNDGLFTGEELHFELELLVDAGLTPLEAITTATKNAAKLMKEDDKWGTLEPGKRADIILVDGRPDKNISDTRNIKLVMVRGRVIEREKLVLNEQTDLNVRDTKFGY
ncbi:amidohydrolase family protein [Aliikangiella coralliicola]|nr:amidohydrolase family protein [Aliikangiella coralliicola]